MLFRKIEKKIEEKILNSNKILLIDGARQIGKTYIIRVVCKKNFKYFNEINLVEDYNSNKYFEKIKTIQDFYLQISSMFGSNLGNKNNTVIFLDEIQVYPHLITMLKFLKDDDKFTYICSGSQLGIALTQTNSLPIGYIEKIRMYPLDFEEFLYANNVGKNVIDNMKEKYSDFESLDEALHDKIIDLFKKYLLIGGFPDAVNEFINKVNVVNVREIHSEILDYYKIDASKYDEINKLKIRKIYDKVPSILENKKRRIVFKDIENIKGKTRKNYENEFEYLIQSGICINVEAISNPNFPLIQSSSKNLLKLYLNDVGLLSNIYFKNNIRSILDNEKNLNNGLLFENVVATELKSHGYNLFYYDNKKNGEIDFMIDDYNNSSVIPIEIKSGSDYKNHKSISKYLTKGKYNSKKGYVFSNEREVQKKDNIIYMPIYYVIFI